MKHLIAILLLLLPIKVHADFKHHTIIHKTSVISEQHARKLANDALDDKNDNRNGIIWVVVQTKIFTRGGIHHVKLYIRET